MALALTGVLWLEILFGISITLVIAIMALK
jgi:hypothetical protein